MPKRAESMHTTNPGVGHGTVFPGHMPEDTKDVSGVAAAVLVTVDVTTAMEVTTGVGTGVGLVGAAGVVSEAGAEDSAGA